jgi:hypothetical protein
MLGGAGGGRGGMLDGMGGGGGQAAQGGAGEMLGSPIAKAVLGGIAAMAVQRITQRR